MVVGCGIASAGLISLPGLIAADPEPQDPIAIVGGAGVTASGSTTTIPGLVDQDYALMFARRASTTPSSVPSGRDYDILATSIGGATSARMFGVRITDAMLTAGVFDIGSFGLPGGAARVWAVALRNVNSLTAAVATSLGAATTTRPFSALSGLNARGVVIGFSYLSVGTGPLPAGSTAISGTGDTVGRLFTAGPTDTWDPADGSAGSSGDWLEMAVGAI